MSLLHGLLLAYSVITIAPLTLLFSMSIPPTSPNKAEPEPPIEAIPVHRHRPKPLEELPPSARRRPPAPRESN